MGVGRGVGGNVAFYNYVTAHEGKVIRCCDFFVNA